MRTAGSVRLCSSCKTKGDSLQDLVILITQMTQGVRSFHELSALDIDKKEVDFSAFEGQVILRGAA